MAKLSAFQESEQLSWADVLTEAKAIEDLAIVEAIEDPGRNGHCEVEAICHAQLGIQNKGAYRYRCGFKIAGTTWGCPKRKRFIEAD